jgi:porin
VRAERALIVATCALLGSTVARAGEASADGTSESSNVALPQFLTRLTNPDNLRTRLEEAGVQITFSYYGDLLGNPAGGVRQSLGYDGRFGTIIDGDLEKLLGWSGATFHASIHQIHGTSFSENNLENIMLVSGVEAPPATRLFNLWVEQKLGSDTTLRVGQVTAAQEFLVSQNATLFVNTTFGWPALPAEDLPSGGPAYPEATPGARIAYTPNDHLTVKAAIFDGNPAGPGAGNPEQGDPYGLAFRVSDPPLLIGEIDYAYNQQRKAAQNNPVQEGTRIPTPQISSASEASGLPGTVKLGAWVLTGVYHDQVSGGSGGAPSLRQNGDYAFYGIVDQALWRVETGSDRGLNFFARVLAAPSDRNSVDRYVDTGLTFKGPIGSRANDILGLAFAYARISPAEAASEPYLGAFAGMPLAHPSFEAALELTYQIEVADRWTVQPDIQYIFHPGAGLADGINPGSASEIPNALVLGMRTAFKF